MGRHDPIGGRQVADATDIKELERRITAALDRIRRGLEAAPGPQTADLAARLEDERMANAQLEERLRALRDRQDATIATLERDLQRERGRVGRMDQDLQALRESNAELRETVAQLRSAVAGNLEDPGLVNRAVIAELEGVKAARAADRTEIEEILAELRPIIEEAS